MTGAAQSRGRSAAVLFAEIPFELKEGLRDLAARNDRTLTAETRLAIAAHITRSAEIARRIYAMHL